MGQVEEVWEEICTVPKKNYRDILITGTNNNILYKKYALPFKKVAVGHSPPAPFSDLFEGHSCSINIAPHFHFLLFPHFPFLFLDLPCTWHLAATPICELTQ